MTKNKTGLKILFILLLALVSLSGIFSHGLWKPDEPRVAEIGREMWLNHQYVIPTLNREPFLEKPPLYWWVMTAFYQFFGVSDGTARLPSALFGFLTLLFTYLIGKRVADEKTGMVAALVLATVTEFSIISHRCLVDNALFFFVTLGYYGFFTGYLSENSKGKWLGYELMAVASGLAFLSKGVVGPGLIVLPPLLVLIGFREFKELKGLLPQVGVGAFLFILIVAPWIIGLYLEGGKPALKEYLLQNTLGRMLPSAISHYMGGHKHSFFYYFRKLLENFVPWIIALPATLAFLMRPQVPVKASVRRGLLQCLVLFAMGFLLLSIPQTKRGLYLVPLYPLLALVIGGWVASVCDRVQGRQTRPIERWTLTAFLGLFTLAPLGIALGSLAIVLTGLGPKGYEMAPILERLTPMLALIVPLGAIAFLFLARKLFQALKSKAAPSCPLLLAMAVLLVLAYHEGATRVMDPVKNMRRFPDKIQPFLKGNPPWAGYRISELTRGIIPFYTGRYLPNIKDPQALSRFLMNHANALLVLPEKELPTLPASLKAGLTLLAGTDYTRRYRLRLYRFQAPVPPPERDHETEPSALERET